MTDTEEDKVVQDANSNLITSDYLGDQDAIVSLAKPGSPVNEPDGEKDESSADVDSSGEYITLTPLSLRPSVSARQLSQQLSQIHELEFSEQDSRNVYAVPTQPQTSHRHEHNMFYSRDDMRDPVHFVDMRGDMHQAMNVRSADEAHMMRMNQQALGLSMHCMSPDLTLRESPIHVQQMRESPILQYYNDNMQSPVHHTMPQCMMNMPNMRESSSPVSLELTSPETSRRTTSLERPVREFISPEPPPQRRYPLLQTQLTTPVNQNQSDWIERHLAAVSQQVPRDNHVSQSTRADPAPAQATSETEITSVTSSTEMGPLDNQPGRVTTSRVTSRRMVRSVTGKSASPSDHSRATPSPPPSTRASLQPSNARQKQPATQASVVSTDGLNHNELVQLETSYHDSPYPSYQQLGKKLGITPFKVKCWFRKRRRNLHQESGAEISVEEETRVFKQFIDDHAAGRTIPSVVVSSTGRAMNLQHIAPAPMAGTSSGNGFDRGGMKLPHPQIVVPIPLQHIAPMPSTSSGNCFDHSGVKVPHSQIGMSIPVSGQQMHTNGKRGRELLPKEPKVATVRPNKTKSKRQRTETSRTKPTTMPIMQSVFPGLPMNPPGLMSLTQPITSQISNGKSGYNIKHQNHNAKNQIPDTTSGFKKECTTPSPAPSPALSTASNTPPSTETTPLIYKNPQIAELMQEREYLGRLLHEQQMQALETRKKLIDVDRELARVSAQLQAQFPYQTPENWAFLAAAHPQLIMIAQAQQQLLHAQNLAVMETQAHYLNQSPTLMSSQGQGHDTRSTSSTPEPDGQALLPSNDYGLSKTELHSDESNT